MSWSRDRELLDKISPVEIERFWAKVDRTFLAGYCWPWRGAKSDNGYPNISVGGSTVYAHRVAYHLVKGPIPAGMIVDHGCGNRSCVRPDHLEAISQGENLRRRHAAAAGKLRTQLSLDLPDPEGFGL
jgi:hypothetical protein